MREFGVCLVFLLFGTVVEVVGHDHAMHPRREFIADYAKRFGAQTAEQLQTELRDIAQNMQKIAKKYDSDTNGKTQVWIDDVYTQTWKANFAPLYQDYADRFLIVQTICRTAYESPSCDLSDIWNDLYDGRGAVFRQEVAEEIVQVWRETDQAMKKARKYNTDL